MSQIHLRRARSHGSATIVGLFAMVFMAFGAPCAAQTDTVRRFDLRIENGRLTESRKVITVQRYDRVEISWRADRRTILHLHGYDIEITPGPDKPEAMTFVARATGRFAIETHTPTGEGKAHHHTVLIYLEVHPR
jgi:hypothetical protein